jgi:recombination protein RecT
MVYGLRKKILQSGAVTDITAKAVYRCEVEAGAFIYEEGTEAMLRHRPMLEMTEEQAKDENIVAFYSMATYKDGTKSYEVMRRFEVDKVRESSQTGATKDKKGNPRRPSGPWVDWYPEQGKKTVMRRHSKTLPMSGDLIDVEARDLDMAARSTAAMLAVEPAKPVALPTADQLDAAQIEDQSGTEAGVQFDAGTGEVLNEPAGMTEVDEETARALDQQGYADMEGGRADHEHGDQHDGSADHDAIADFLQRINAVKSKDALGKLDQEFQQISGTLSDGHYAQLDAALAAAGKRLNRA